MTAVLQIEQLSVDFDGFLAVDTVDLTVEQGELRFLIGPNGAGKTTLVDLVTGLTRATSGSIRFDGQELIGRREPDIVHLGVGRTFQTPTVFDDLTVLDNVDLAASHRRSLFDLLRRRRGVTDDVMAVLDTVGLATHAQRPAGVLAHGQRQWLEIAMLLVQQPRLLLLDEPVAGMTGAEREQTGRLLEQLAEDRTVVVIEHDMEFLRRFARRVTVMHEGRILTEGSVDEIRNNPRVREVYLGRSEETAGPAPPAEPHHA